MISLISFTPTICLVIRHADVIIPTPTIAADARTVVQTHAFEIVDKDSSESSMPIMAAMAMAIEIWNRYSTGTVRTVPTRAIL